MEVATEHAFALAPSLSESHSDVTSVSYSSSQNQGSVSWYLNPGCKKRKIGTAKKLAAPEVSEENKVWVVEVRKEWLPSLGFKLWELQSASPPQDGACKGKYWYSNLEVKADELGPDELMPVGEQRFTPWHRSYTNLKLQRNEKAFWVRVQVRTGNKCVKKKMLKYVQIIDELHQRDQAYNFMQRCEVEGLEFIAREIDESPDSQCAQTKIPPIAPDAAHTSPSSIQNFRPAIDDDTSSNRQTPLRHEPSEINPTKEDAFAALSVAPPSKLDFCKDAPNALVHQSPARTPNSHSQTIAVVKAAAPFPAANNHISMQYDGVLMNHGHQGPYVSHSHLPFQTGNASAASQAPDWNAHQLWQIQSFEAAIRNISYSFPTNCVTSSYPTAPSSLEPKGLNPQSNSSPSVTYPTAEKKIQGIRPNTSTLTNGTCNFQSAGNFDANKHGGGDNRAAVRDSADSASSETNALHRNGQGSPAKSTNNSAQWRSPRKKRKKVAKKEDSKPQEEPVCIVLSDGEGENHVEEKSVKTDPLFDLLLYIISTGDLGGGQTVFQLPGEEALLIKASVMFGRDDRVSLDSADQHGLVFSIAEARGAGVRLILSEDLMGTRDAGLEPGGKLVNISMGAKEFSLLQKTVVHMHENRKRILEHCRSVAGTKQGKMSNFCSVCGKRFAFPISSLLTHSRLSHPTKEARGGVA